jgi:hypothetical protein
LFTFGLLNGSESYVALEARAGLASILVAVTHMGRDMGRDWFLAFHATSFTDGRSTEFWYYQRYPSICSWMFGSRRWVWGIFYICLHFGLFFDKMFIEAFTPDTKR